MPETKEVLELLLYPLAKIPVLQKHSKLERMSGCSYPFITEKGNIIEWMAATGLVN